MSNQQRVLVAAFYEFFDLEDSVDLRNWLLARGEGTELRGTVLLADEGINGTLAGPHEPLREVLCDLRERAQIGLNNCKLSTSETQPFRRFRVRVKPELVTFRQPAADPRRTTGTYVSPLEWNQVIAREGVRLIDTRNDYETAIGTFSGAEDPNTENFTDFAGYVDQHLDPQTDTSIAMFCTGGIRCEKASSYLLAKGFEQVFHLEGGILRYLEEITPAESEFKGECYVFDERVSVNHALKPGQFRNCAECGWPAATGCECDKCGTLDTRG